MRARSKRNLIAYGVLVGACLAVSLVRMALPDVFANGPPSFNLFLSIPGTAVIGALGLIGVFALNGSTLRGLWDDDQSALQKLVVPFAAGILVGLVNVVMRQFIPIDEAVASFVKSMGVPAIDPSLAGAILGYASGGILINVYFLIVIPVVVYLVSDRLLKGRKQGVVFWSVAIPLALWEPLTNPPLDFSIATFGALGAMVIVAFGLVFTLLQVWFMRRSGFVALVAARLGLYAITHAVYPRLV